eukprot:768000-Hanusia_phi.AAC.4
MRVLRFESRAPPAQYRDRRGPGAAVRTQTVVTARSDLTVPGPAQSAAVSRESPGVLRGPGRMVIGAHCDGPPGP